MCGILTVYDKSNRINESNFFDALKLLEHRGPDSLNKKILNNNKVYLGHSRLSIIDLTENANQPIFNENDALSIICNGEIYNYKELKEELKNLGHSFKSDSDSEVILHGFEEWGTSILDKIEGMFSFVIYDNEKDEMFIARDGMGIKPLYYYYNDKDFFIVSSELKPIKSILSNLNISTLGLSYLLSICHIPSPYTIWEDVFKLDPGSYLTFKNNKISIKNYWQPASTIDYKRDYSQDEWDKLFNNVVDHQLIADVPVGLFLSAGLDSTSIALASVNTKKNIHPLTLGFKDSPLDEIYIASEVTKELSLEHKTKILELDDIDLLINKVSSYIDEPILFSSLLVMDSISEYASQNFKTIISGSGGDEVLGGYSWQKSKFKSFYLNQNGINMVSLANMLRKNLTYEESFLYSYLKKSSMRFKVNQLHRLFPDSKKNFSAKKLVEPYLKYYSSKLPIIRRIQKLDLMIFCSGINLSLVDKASMHNSLEVRVPFLDRNIVDWGIQKPVVKDDMKMKTSKNTLRNYLKGKISDKVLKMKKRGFRMLNMDKINYEMYLEEVLDSKLVRENYFDKKYIIELFNKKDIAKIYSLVFITKWIKAQNI